MTYGDLSMEARRLRPPVPKPTFIQCCVPVDVMEYSKEYIARRKKRAAERSDDWQHDHCMKHATVEIDGRPYCRPHAGQVALARLLEEPDPDYHTT